MAYGGKKEFNITGLCIPKLHYMVDTSEKVSQIIEKYVERGAYVTMNCARKYGKTTTLELLYHRLKEKYIVIDISFEAADDCFASIHSLAADNELFLLFLGLLRGKYLRRKAGRDSTFKSVILAGVHDIKNLKMELRPNEERQYNSPWNIAADFDVDMAFSAKEIESMLREYEMDCRTGMDIPAIAGELYEYTGGYPFLVSWICKKVDEEQLSWTSEGLRLAVKQLLSGTNTLFDDLIKNLENHPEFRNLVEAVLARGEEIPFVPSNPEIARGVMYGIFRKSEQRIAISNQIFETYIYEYLISVNKTWQFLHPKYSDKSQYVRNGKLNMRKVLEQFSAFLKSEYRKEDGRFIERQGQLLFLCFLRPIINGTGHYAVEAQTRQNARMDIQVFYGREEFVVELKFWHGIKRKRQGYQQLANYLDARGLEEGYMVSFCSNLKSPKENQDIGCQGHKIYEVVAYQAD